MINEIAVKVEKVNNILVTTSNRVAEELGVEHRSLLRKIDGYVEKFSSAQVCAQFYIASNYKTKDGRSVKNYLITEKGIAQLIGGYSAAVPKAFDLNVAYINEFERMKNYIKENDMKINEKDKLLLGLFSNDKMIVAQSYKELVKLEKEPLEIKIKEDAPKVQFYDDVTGSDSTMSISQVAKTLNFKNIGRNKLFQILRDKNILQKNNEPYQYFVDQGWFRIVESRFVKPSGDICINLKTVVFQKGLDKIANILKEEGYERI